MPLIFLLVYIMLCSYINHASNTSKSIQRALSLMPFLGGLLMFVYYVVNADNPTNVQIPQVILGGYMLAFLYVITYIFFLVRMKNKLSETEIFFHGGKVERILGRVFAVLLILIGGYFLKNGEYSAFQISDTFFFPGMILLAFYILFVPLYLEKSGK